MTASQTDTDPHTSKSRSNAACALIQVQISTSEYKIRPIKAEVRRRLGYPHPARVPAGVWAQIDIGISVDEIHRARDADVAYMRNTFPLLELGWRRDDCRRYLNENGLTGFGKSSCIGCLIWNLARLLFSAMIEIPWSKFPQVDGHQHAHRWLQFYANIGRAPNTIVAYGRAVDDHLRFLGEAGIDPLVAGLDVVAAWIGDMLSRPNPRGAVLVHLDSGAGLANATVQQRILVTWNLAAAEIMSARHDHGLRRHVGRRGDAGQVAGIGQA